MPKIIRNGDNSAGTDNEPSPPKEWSDDVFANNKEVVRKDDKYEDHPDDPEHEDRFASEGSPNVFINDKAVHRENDDISCGDNAGDGSNNVFVNEGTSSLFIVPPDPTIPLSPSQQAGFAYNQSHREQYRTPQNIIDQTGDLPEVPPPDVPTFGECSTTEPNVPETPTEHPDIISMLSTTLNEAASGQWKENGHNANIIATYKDVGNPQRSDQVAWCAGFVGAILKRTCHKYIKGNLAAGAFTGYGNPVSLSTVKKGDILVFYRDGGTGHVGFYWGEGRPGYVKLVGGNQSNNLSVIEMPISRLKPNGVQRPIDVNP